MRTGGEMNSAIFFSLTSPIYLFILKVGIRSSGGNVSQGTILRSCSEVSDLAGGVMVYASTSIDESTDLHICCEWR
ncbi:hypothetical protein TNCV_2504321 [Trichonephila clavipes]|uniref:Uncharacterized protein n=1 Tax=Trichonephila clavipes TaxID=2585209 RepID=A0A8X7BL00_TRICX|nr:hypothetical protein TNCV_2504321 [Trichonephila clavipes]